jgi:NAD(P)-dependent dehydrogenase (short-subunit alcohol dehydrogenase family)
MEWMYRGVVATGLTDFVNPKHDALIASMALGRIGQAEEIAKANMFLLSDVSSFITASVSGKFPGSMSS